MLNTEPLNVPQGNNSRHIYTVARCKATGTRSQVWKRGRSGERSERRSKVVGGREKKKRGKGKEIISRQGGETETQDTIRTGVEGEKQFNQVMTKTVPGPVVISQ